MQSETEEASRVRVALQPTGEGCVSTSRQGPCISCLYSLTEVVSINSKYIIRDEINETVVIMI